MNVSAPSQPKIVEFFCSGYKECITNTYYQLLHAVFESPQEVDSNTFQFSLVFSDSLEKLILSNGAKDRDREIRIVAQRKSEVVELEFSYRSDDNRPADASPSDPDGFRLSFPVRK